MLRKSIIYDKKTPEVFYCPLAKHEGKQVLKYIYIFYLLWEWD
jgi:hypothetical protein